MFEYEMDSQDSIVEVLRDMGMSEEHLRRHLEELSDEG